MPVDPGPAPLERARALGLRPYMIYAALTYFAADGDRCTVSWPQLSDATGISERTVRRHTKALIAEGLLRVLVQGGGRGLPTVYQLVHRVTDQLEAAPAPTRQAMRRRAVHPVAVRRPVRPIALYKHGQQPPDKGVQTWSAPAPLYSNIYKDSNTEDRSTDLSELTDHPPQEDMGLRDRDRAAPRPEGPADGGRTEERPSAAHGHTEERSRRGAALSFSLEQLLQLREVQELAHVHQLSDETLRAELGKLMRKWQMTVVPPEHKIGPACASWIAAGIRTGHITQTIKSDPHRYNGIIPL